MGTLRPLGLGLVAVTLAAAAAAAQDAEEAMRPCRPADVIGLWEVIRFGFASGAPVDRDDPAYRLHQRFLFRADAGLVYRASPVPLTLDDERALREATPDVTWTLEPGGRLLRQPTATARAEHSDCQVITRPVRDPRSPMPALPGDVLLTDRAPDERPLVRRLLRKVLSGR